MSNVFDKVSEEFKISGIIQSTLYSKDSKWNLYCTMVLKNVYYKDTKIEEYEIKAPMSIVKQQVSIGNKIEFTCTENVVTNELNIIKVKISLAINASYKITKYWDKADFTYFEVETEFGTRFYRKHKTKKRTSRIEFVNKDDKLNHQLHPEDELDLKIASILAKLNIHNITK